MNYKQYREWVNQRLSTTKPYGGYSGYNVKLPAPINPVRELSGYDYYGSPEGKALWLEQRNEVRDRNN
jgi:hypothetical protein